jgi:hypothetical protein
VANQSAVIKIAGNGEDSFNNAALNNNSDIVISDTNIADILNNVETNLNTGGNEALKNVGDTAIITGNITNDVTINNENINSNFVKVSCNCEKQPEQKPSTPPVTTPASGSTSVVQGASGSSSSSSSSSNGPAAGAMLPATGSTLPFTLIATLLLFFTFLSGLYLRFHPANAPPTK